MTRSAALEIVLVRHAEPEWEPGGFAVDEPGLSARGRRQAERAAQALVELGPFDAIYQSPLRRVRETAKPILAALDQSAIEQSWLAELGLPSLAGRTTEEVARFFADARDRDLEHWWDGLPGGESFRHFYERVSSGIEGLLAGEHRLRVHEDGGHRIWQVSEGGRLLILAHEGTNAVLISHLVGIDPVPWAPVRFASAHAAIHHLRTIPIAKGVVWVLDRFNGAEHLKGL
jgi:2,3-bisphosphoglycerate-dependent phosphoglycerate mutase